MSFPRKRIVLAGGLLVLLPALLFLSPSGRPPLPAEAEAPAKAVPQGGFRDPGALQDDMAPPIPLSEEELARFLRPRAEGTPPEVEGGRYYRGTPLTWAAEERLRGPYRDYLPAPPPPAVLEEARNQALDLLRAAEAAAAALKAGAVEVRPYFLHALRRLNILSLRHAGDVPLRIARVRALNGIARALSPEEGLTASTLAADLVREITDPSPAAQPRQIPPSFLTQWGIALMGMARPEQGAQRDLLLRKAGEKLRQALDGDPGQSAAAYALALAAAEKGDGDEARDMLRKAAQGKSPVSRQHLAGERAFDQFRAAPWFARLAGAFPALSAAGFLPPEEAAAWVAREKRQARPPLEEGSSGAGYLRWARSLASTSGWEGDPARSRLMRAEIQELFSSAQASADPPLTREDYLLWGDALSVSPRAACSAEDRLRLKNALDAYRKALNLDPSFLNAFQSLLWGYDLLLSCTDEAKERRRIFEARDSAAQDCAPANAADLLHLSRVWAYNLAQWAGESPPALRERRNREGIAKLEQALATAEQDRDAKLAAEARRSLASFKLHLAANARDRESRAALLASAEADAGIWLSGLPPEGAEDPDLRDAAWICLELAKAFDGDLDRKRRYAQEALRRHDLLEQDGEGTGRAGALEQLGIAEQDPERKRELLFLAATLYQQALEEDPSKSWLWNAWGIALSRLAQLPSLAGREAVFLLARDVFLWEEAMRPGSEAYNLACVFALMGRIEDCRRWLERAGSFKALPSRLHMQTDSDLDPVRHLPWFSKILPEE
ncbi:MAG: hypothetical protein LBP61_08995 [Desulfovibrio sp.]|jgi:hypothetical protein|nr:hypothetical protein [Desulfovibrio sp.]